MENDHQSSEGKVKNITLGLILSWFIGLLFLVAGIGLMFSSVIGGGLVVLGGVLMLPSVNGFLKRKYSLNVSGGVRFVIALILVAVGGGMAVSSTVDTAKERASTLLGATSTSTTSTSAATPQGTERLELLSFKCSVEYGFSKITGEVKNISDKPMENVMAVGSFYTDSGEFVKSSDALITYNPILVGQASPFEVITTSNPAATSCKIEFKEFFGGIIPTKRTAPQS